MRRKAVEVSLQGLRKMLIINKDFATVCKIGDLEIVIDGIRGGHDLRKSQQASSERLPEE